MLCTSCCRPTEENASLFTCWWFFSPEVLLSPLLPGAPPLPSLTSSGSFHFKMPCWDFLHMTREPKKLCSISFRCLLYASHHPPFVEGPVFLGVGDEGWVNRCIPNVVNSSESSRTFLRGYRIAMCLFYASVVFMPVNCDLINSLIGWITNIC